MFDQARLPELWANVETVLLDMDGTLLDKHFDDFFWERFVPQQYATMHELGIEEARARLLELYKSREGTLEWTDLDFWSAELGLDIPALKHQVDHLIQVHPYVPDFLEFCARIGKKTVLVTNAHGKTLQIKLRKTAIGRYFDEIYCSQEIGLAKEQPEFWRRLQLRLHFEPQRTLLCDDTAAVLHTAAEYGIRYLIFVARASSKADPVAISRYPSINFFNELILPCPEQDTF